MGRPTVLIAEPDRFSASALALLREAADVTLGPVDVEGLADAFGTHDVVWVRLARRITADVLGPSPRARILAAPVTGLDHIDLDACAQRGIEVISLKGEVDLLRHVRATAEHTVGLLLALLRQIPAASAAAAAGEWDRDKFPGHELYEKTTGIVGVGRLGTLVAGYLRAFGMRILGTDPDATIADGVLDERCDLPSLLRRSDVVSLHVPYDATTHHLIGERELAAMAPHAVLINTSRGGVVDEASLDRALRSGALAGAALDVLDGEPDIGPDHPLVRLAERDPRLLLTPHVGGNTPESFDRTEHFIATKVVAALKRADVVSLAVPDDTSRANR